MEKMLVLASLVAYVVSLMFFQFMYFITWLEKEIKHADKTHPCESWKVPATALSLILNLFSGAFLIFFASMIPRRIIGLNHSWRIIAIVLLWFILAAIISWVAIIIMDKGKIKARERCQLYRAIIAENGCKSVTLAEWLNIIF